MVDALLAGVISAIAGAVATSLATFYIPGIRLFIKRCFKKIWSCLKGCFFRLFPTFENIPLSAPIPPNPPNPPNLQLPPQLLNPPHPLNPPDLPDQGLGDLTNRGRIIIAKDLEIEHLHNNECWNLVVNDDPSELRFTEVAELLKVWHFEIKTSMNFLGLSANTQYGSYLIFKRTEDSEGLHVIMNTLVSVVGKKPETKSVCLNPTSATPASVGRPEARSDGWLELELGKFDCDIVTNKDAVIIIKETKRMDIRKTGLTVAGIEIRPIESPKHAC